MILKILHTALFFCFINILCFGQFKFEKTVAFTKEKTEVSNIAFARKYLGQLQLEVDSSFRNKYAFEKIEIKEVEVLSNELPNIGQGKPLQLELNENKLPVFQTYPFEGFKRVENAFYPISKINEDNNLLTGNISCYLLDKSQKLWVAYEEGGLSVISGQNIRHLGEIPILSHSRIIQFIEHDNVIWIATANNGIFGINLVTDTYFNLTFPRFGNLPDEICINTKQNTLWFKSRMNLYRLEGNTFFEYSINEFGSNALESILYDKKNDQIEVIDSKNIVYQIETDFSCNSKELASQSNYEFRDWAVGKQTSILFEDGIVISLEDESARMRQFDISSLTSIYESKAGNIWCGGVNGEIRVSFDNLVSKISSEHGLQTYSIKNFFQDDFDQIWMATSGDGIVLISQSNFKTLFSAEYQYYNHSSKIANKKNEFIFTHRNGFNVLNSDKHVLHYYNEKLENPVDLLLNNDIVYLASESGIYQIKNDSIFVIQHPLSSQKKYNNISNLGMDKENQILYAINKKYGLYEINLKTLNCKNYSSPSLKSLHSLFFIDENLWIASYNQELMKLNDQVCSVSNIEVGLTEHLVKDQQSNLWIASSSGIYRMNGDSISKLMIDKYAISNHAKSIYFEKDNIWVGTQKNLLQLNAKTLECNVHTSNEGIIGSNYGSKQICKVEEEVFFATNKGISNYNFREIKRPQGVFEINHSIAERGPEAIYKLSENKITGQIDKKPIKIEIGNNYWGAGDNIRLFYQINDNPWKESSDPYLLEVTPRSMKFKISIKAITINGIESNIVSIDVLLYEPIYKKAWFMFVVISIILGGIFYFLSRQVDFDFTQIQGYSDLNFYRSKIRFLVGVCSFMMTALDLICCYYFKYYEPNFIWLTAFVITSLTLAVYTFTDLANSEKRLHNFVLIHASFILCVLYFRVAESNYHFTYSLYMGTLILSSILWIEKVNRFFMFLIFVSAGTIAVFITEPNENIAMFMFTVIFALIFSMIYHIFQLGKDHHIAFSDHVLKNYDKLLIIYNKKGNLVYANEKILSTFNVSENDVLGDNWYKLRGCDEIETKRIKDDIGYRIDIKTPTENIQEEIYSVQTMRMENLDWEFQVIDDDHLMATGTFITDFLKNQEEIKKLSTITQKINNGVVRTDLDGKIIWANESFVKIAGVELEEMLGRRPSEIFLTPDHFKDEFKRLQENHHANSTPFVVTHYNGKGEIIHLLIDTNPIYNKEGELVEIVEIITDLTQERKQNEAFQKVSLIAEHTQNPTLILDDNYEVTWFNGSFSDTFGYTEFELSQNSLAELIFKSKHDQYLFNKLLQDVSNGNIQTGECKLLDIKGNENWMKISLDPVLDSKGELNQIVCIMQNIQNLKDTQAILEEKNRNITDSISYAQRIQKAILPNLNLLKKFMPEYFMYYKPKDIVSGDFYYAEFFDDKLILGIADCTGHGIPGAMMTSICAAALNIAILDRKKTDLTDILEFVDMYVKNSLSASSDQLSDGMDIALIAFNIKDETIEFVGAKRPLILINQNNEIEKIEGTKRSIGETFSEIIPFEKHVIEAKKYKMLFAFSDGYSDQFGGENAKKIYLKGLLSLIHENHSDSLENQKNKLVKHIENWTGNFSRFDQTDDILVFGAKIEIAFFQKLAKKINT